MSYKHALFLNPYIESSATSTMKLFPPTGLEYVATSAKGSVDKITLLDLRYEKEFWNTAKLLDFILQEIDIICVGIGWDRQFKQICELLSQMPDNIPLVVGGYTASEKVEELFKVCPKINIIVRGEGEETIKEILGKEPLENILGISYRVDDKVVHNANRPLPRVDSIVSPDRSLRRNDYRLTLNGVEVMNITFDTVLSARGCPFNCKFCTFKLNPLGQKRDYSARSVDSVIKEIEQIKAKFILFSDDSFAADPKRTEKLCDELIKRKINKRFVAQVRIELARYPALLEKMFKAGFKALLIGIESPHDRILAQLNKGFTSDTVRQAFAVFKKYPIIYNGYFIYGNIGESEEEMVYIAQFAKEIGLDVVTHQKLRIEKFSPLRQIAEKTPGYHVTETGALYSDKYSHPELKKIGKRIKFSFYTPSKYLSLLKKVFWEVKIFTPGEMASFFLALPLVIKSVLVREIHKKRLGDSLWRTFVRNK